MTIFYLKPNRLADILVAIQAMSTSEHYKRSCEDWADLISGDKSKANYWKEIFEEHGEFFRKSPSANERHGEDRYSLTWRRAYPRVHKQTKARLKYEDYSVLSPEEKKQYGRLELATDQIKVLIDSAIKLHEKAAEQSRDWRWWVAPALTIISAILGALLGAYLGGKH